MMASPTLSVIVPALDEEAYIGRCLDALMTQIDQIDEILVVDNGSTDGTRSKVGEAAQRCPKVRLIDEPRRGIIPARNAGLDAATSDLLARIDADTFVDEGWAHAIRSFFAANPDYAAATGPGRYHDGPNISWRRLLRRNPAPSPDPSGWREYGGGVFGANMVLRKEIWRAIRGGLHDRPGIWEDADLNAALVRDHYRSAAVFGMSARVSARRFLSGPRQYWRYTRQGPATLRLNGMRGAAIASWIPVWQMRLFYLLYWIPVRMYDPSSGGFDLRRIFGRHGHRPLPDGGSR
jgi:glycosyltransferase involved in cell wall biosynthesis